MGPRILTLVIVVLLGALVVVLVLLGGVRVRCGDAEALPAPALFLFARSPETAAPCLSEFLYMARCLGIARSTALPPATLTLAAPTVRRAKKGQPGRGEESGSLVAPCGFLSLEMAGRIALCCGVGGGAMDGGGSLDSVRFRTQRGRASELRSGGESGGENGGEGSAGGGTDGTDGSDGSGGSGFVATRLTFADFAAALAHCAVASSGFKAAAAALAAASSDSAPQ